MLVHFLNTLKAYVLTLRLLYNSYFFNILLVIAVVNLAMILLTLL